MGNTPSLIPRESPAPAAEPVVKSSNKPPSKPSKPSKASKTVKVSKVTAAVRKSSTPKRASRVDGGRRAVSGRNLTIRRDVVAPPADAGIFVFHDPAGRQECWKLGQHNAKQFCSRLDNQVDAVLFNPDNKAASGSDALHIFFPYVDGGAAYRQVRVKKPVTLRKVLQEVDVTALQVAAKLLAEEGANGVITEAQADLRLKDTAVCSLLMRRTGGARHVYVQLQVMGRGSILQSA